MPLATTSPSSSINTSVIDAVTIQQTMNGSWPDFLNYSCILKKMEEAGTISKKGSGAWLTKNIDVGLPEANERSAAQERTFASENDYVNLILPWTNVESTRGLSRIDIATNSGPEGKVKLAEQMIPKLVNGMKVGLFSRLLTYNTGSQAVAGFPAQTANPPKLGGAASLFGYGPTAQAYNPIDSSTSGNWSATSKEVLPDTMYYNVATNPLTPPASVANPQKECLSPVISAYNATVWNAVATGTWANNCREILTHHMQRQTRGNGPDEKPDFAVMTGTMWSSLINTFQTYNRVALVGGQGADPNMRAVSGTEQVIPYGFLSLHWDAYLTQEVCYVLNSKKMGMDIIPQDNVLIDPSLPNKAPGSLFAVETQSDIRTGSALAVVSMIGQMWFDPRWHGMSYAAT